MFYLLLILESLPDPQGISSLLLRWQDGQLAAQVFVLRHKSAQEGVTHLNVHGVIIVEEGFTGKLFLGFSERTIQRLQC